MRSLSSYLLFVAFAATMPTFAQVTTAELSGNVTDPDRSRRRQGQDHRCEYRDRPE